MVKQTMYKLCAHRITKYGIQLPNVKITDY